MHLYTPLHTSTHLHTQDTAGQLRRSPYEFAGIGATSPLLWLARKFAILDGPTMPIIAGVVCGVWYAVCCAVWWCCMVLYGVVW